jgi:predicted nucleic acid-binding protein
VSKIFLDTNILLYTLDENNKDKQKNARKIVQNVTKHNTSVISTQIIEEFYVASTSKFDVEPLLAKSIVHSFENMEVVRIDPYLIREAIDTSILNQISFWDSLVVVAAESAKCETLYTEDLNAGQIIRGVKIENPFHT